MQGLNVLHEGGIHDGHVFVKLLTNRAACHLSLARPLKALQDCTMAVQVCTLLHAISLLHLHQSGRTSFPVCIFLHLSFIHLFFIRALILSLVHAFIHLSIHSCIW